MAQSQYVTSAGLFSEPIIVVLMRVLQSIRVNTDTSIQMMLQVPVEDYPVAL